MTEHSEFEHQRLNKDEFKLFNEELYSTISCVVADLLWHKYGVEGKCPKCNHDTKGGGWLYGNLISECGVLSMEPNDDVSCQFKNPPSGKDFALTLLMSSDSYHEAHRYPTSKHYRADAYPLEPVWSEHRSLLSCTD